MTILDTHADRQISALRRLPVGGWYLVVFRELRADGLWTAALWQKVSPRDVVAFVGADGHPSRPLTQGRSLYDRKATEPFEHNAFVGRISTDLWATLDMLVAHECFTKALLTAAPPGSVIDEGGYLRMPDVPRMLGA